MSIYTKEHYEDVAAILKGQVSSAAPLNWIGHIAEVETNATVQRIARRFADLFTADNPRDCPACDPGEVHGGFDREQFLAACGLEPDTVPIEDVPEAIEPPHRYG